MYGWIWRRLPGSPFARVLLAAALVLAALALLWFVIFPAAESFLPYLNVDVGAP